MADGQSTAISAKCVASNVEFSRILADTSPEGRPSQAHAGKNINNYFKQATWSADGTTIVTSTADHHTRSFVLPVDLLDDDDAPKQLEAYSVIPSAEPVYSTALFPHFQLSDPTTTLVLQSPRDHPIGLWNVLDQSASKLGSYPLVNPTTEKFITPHSLLWPSSLGANNFITGSESLVCMFDVSRPGEEPIWQLPTIPSRRKKIVGGGVGIKGIVSALAASPEGGQLLAAGTFTRKIGLYSSNGAGDSVGVFPVSGTEADRKIGGQGITQLSWSPDGRYLFVAERKSDGVLVYDIRVTGKLLGWLQGRSAMSMQRLGIDICQSSNTSCELWAGGTDGNVRVYVNPHRSEGGIEYDWKRHFHDDSVSSVVIHPTGAVAASCSGQRHYEELWDLKSTRQDLDIKPATVSEAKNELKSSHMSTALDNSLKLWSLTSEDAR